MAENEYRVLSYWDPWGTAMCLGLKHVETRPKKMNHRGVLLIHIALNTKGVAEDFPRVRHYFAASGYGVSKMWPFGTIIGAVIVKDCVRTETVRGFISAQEMAFGDYSNGRWAIITSDWVMFDKPIRYSGQQGLFTYRGNEALPPIVAEMERKFMLSRRVAQSNLDIAVTESENLTEWQRKNLREGTWDLSKMPPDDRR